MAIVEVKVPQLSESVAEATLLTWKKKPGEAVAMDEILIEVETDKVVLEVPAPAAGVLAELVQPDGATVAADQLIARIDTAAQSSAVAAPVAAAPAAVATAAPTAAASKGDIAMPAAAKLMADKQMAARLGARHRQGRPSDQGRRAGRCGCAQGSRPCGACAGRSGPPACCPQWPRRQRPAWVNARNSACRCRACARASPNAWCNPNPPMPS
jgi:2-oxoglutarate dehydrogenase E2 component (dihydrolipoamide succinyltransferase)